jgi:FkbM family methyltransferase
MIFTGGPTFRRTLQKELLDDPDPYGIRTCGPVDVVLDLGANCGMFSLLARFLHPAARVVSVEPDSRNFAALKSNTEGLRIEVVNHAIGISGQVNLLNPHTSPGAYQYDKGLAPPTENSVMSCRLFDTWASLGISECCNRSDRLFSRTFLKIDTEGAEKYFIGNPDDEACIESCFAVGAEIHGGGHYGSHVSIAEYQQWFLDRFSATHDIQFTISTKRPSRLAYLRMKRKQQ